MTNFWLVKQEPQAYPFSALEKDGCTAWTGVRNYQARNNLRAMKPGEMVFFYHSGDQKSVVGLATVAKAAYADPTASEGDWSCVDLAAVKSFPQPVSLAQVKADANLREMPLVKNSRLSVSPVSASQARRLMALAGLAQ